MSFFELVRSVAVPLEERAGAGVDERDRAQLELRTTRLEASLTQANLDALLAARGHELEVALAVGLQDAARYLVEYPYECAEQTASLLRAPATLDDQSVGYQYIMYAKGAFVYKLMRDTLGPQKFEQLLNLSFPESGHPY